MIVHPAHAADTPLVLDRAQRAACLVQAVSCLCLHAQLAAMGCPGAYSAHLGRHVRAGGVLCGLVGSA